MKNKSNRNRNLNRNHYIPEILSDLNLTQDDSQTLLLSHPFSLPIQISTDPSLFTPNHLHILLSPTHSPFDGYICSDLSDLYLLLSFILDEPQMFTI